VNNDASSGHGSVDQRHAETLARLFNLVYNSAILYGGAHQTTTDSAVPFCNFVTKLVKGDALVSLLAERESVYIENHCVDKIINVRRLVTHFKNAGLQSITFSSEVSLEGIKAFLQILSDKQTYPTAELMKKGLALQNARGIRLNYVVYRKMTADEAIVNKDAAMSPPGASPQDSSVARQVLDGLSGIMSAQQLMDGPKAGAPRPAGQTGLSQGANLDDLLAQLRAVNMQMKTPSSGGAMSGQQMVEAVIKLKKQVTDNLDLIRKTHDLNESENLVASEVDAMSHEVMLRLIREEYKGGGVSMRRLAQIIRRMMPDVKELKRMLPGLKDVLLKEGMPPAEYLQLVTDLLRDIDSDGHSGVFEGAVQDIGISMDELVETIKEDPADAARLIVLASEIRKSTHQDTAQLSSLLTDYVERVSRSLALESKEMANREGIHLVKAAIGRIENDLVDKLKRHGIPQAVLDQASQELLSRLDKTAAEVKQEWASRFVGSLRDAGETQIIQTFKDMVRNETDAQLLQGPFADLLKTKGYADARIAEFFEKAKSASAKAQSDLPKGVLNVNATLYFLEREIKRHQRYNSPFSSLIVTVELIRPEKGPLRNAGEAEHQAFMPTVLLHLRRVLRDLDIVGSLGLVSRDVPFVVLPMTEGPGAAAVSERLEKELNAMDFESRGEHVHGVFAISYASFDKKVMTGYRSFLEHALSCHKKREELVRTSAGV
jgi:hypothetical protein